MTAGVSEWSVFLHAKGDLVPSNFVEKYGSTFLMFKLPWANDTKWLPAMREQYALIREEATLLNRDANR